MNVEGLRIKKNLKLGNTYKKNLLSEILEENNLRYVREGLYYCVKSNSTLFFVDLVKVNKPERFKFNDYFEGDYFHWDSQTTQHLNSPKIQEIVNKEKEVHLFCREYPKVKSVSQPFVYCGQLEYFTHEKNTSKPVHIIFRSMDYDDETSNDNLLNLYTWSPNKVGRDTSNVTNLSKDISPKRKRNYIKPNTTERKGLVISRVGQGWYRREILNRWNGKCSITGCSLDRILISSHIVPWSKSNDDERLDVGNGILLSPNLDSLFDRHLISFEDSGEVIISDKLKDNDLELLGINRQMRLRVVFDDMKLYLSRHRKEFFSKN